MGTLHDKLAERRTQQGFTSGWKPKDGDNHVVVLPPHSKFIGNFDAMGDLALQFKLHYFRIEGRQTEVSRCRQDLGQRCLACQAWRLYKDSDDPAVQKMADDIRAADH